MNPCFLNRMSVSKRKGTSMKVTMTSVTLLLMAGFACAENRTENGTMMMVPTVTEKVVIDKIWSPIKQLNNKARWWGCSCITSI